MAVNISIYSYISSDDVDSSSKNTQDKEETSDPPETVLNLDVLPETPGIKRPGNNVDENSGVVLNIPGISAETNQVGTNEEMPAPVKWVPVPEMIKAEGYPSESHFVTTSDGYILNLHRIPHGKDPNKKKKDTPVYIQHGLLCSSADWVILGPKRSLAYILADEGYDVWLGNARGNTYSRNHTTLNPDEDSAFWAFSWHEIGIIDVPTMIDYILNATGKSQVFHIGHSQGATTFYVMTSELLEYNQKIKAHISLSPVAYMKHSVSPLIRFLGHDQLTTEDRMSLIGKNEFMPVDSFMAMLNAAICNTGIGSVYCKISTFALAGFSPDQMDAKDTAIICAHYPAGSSARQVIHCAQEVTSPWISKYDFGKLKNRLIYDGGSYPSIYVISKISAPIHIFYSSNDWLANEKDVEKLLYLRCLEDKYWVPISTWNNLDYLFGKDAPRLIYKRVINVLSKYDSKY